MKSVGEVEFARGMAAMGASGLFGDAQICTAIVGSVDLRLGDPVQEVLNEHVAAAGERFRGVRHSMVAYDDDTSILGRRAGVPRLLMDSDFRSGFSYLHKLGLSYDVFLLEPQLPELIDLTRAFPDTQIVLNHMGTPVGVGRYAGQQESRFAIWRQNMRTLAGSGNVAVKLGGMGIPFTGLESHTANARFNSAQLAAEWKPYIDACIEIFGAERCMFESNFPVDSATADYRVLWNTFKRIMAGASSAEKIALFSGTAERIYQLERPHAG